jgi:hypothetical protein
MKRSRINRLFFYLNLLCATTAFSQPFQSGTDILKAMHKKYYQGPCKCYTFSQKNTHYKGDSISGHSVWHEAVEFPDKFRINFGDKTAGNYIVFKNDSAFNYKNGKQVKARSDSNTLLLLLGGMYYRELENVLTRLKNAEYNFAAFSEQTWQNRDHYVIGAKKGDSLANQVWVDRLTYRVTRIIEKLNDTETMDIRFESYQPWCRGHVETRVSFRRNGKLEQEEEYYDIKETKVFPE